MNRNRIERIEAMSLKSQCAEALERLIISGELAVGSSLPPEREFAQKFGVSRPVLHEAIVDLQAKGFLSIEPRRGVRVRDFYREGTLATFEAIVLHADGTFPVGILEDVMSFRALIELEAVKLAANRGGGEFLAALRLLVEEEKNLQPLPAELERRSSLDFRFHLLVAEASGNRILPLVVNSIAPVYNSLILNFYRAGPDVAMVEAWHRQVVEAIGARKAKAAVRLAAEMLAHGSLVITEAYKRSS